MKTHYDLLSLERTASADEVKRAFRREIARYHPDKVQHLGPEFQEIAATRAAELTEAYRILMDAALRSSYDESLDDGRPAPAPPAAPAAHPPAASVEPPSPAGRPAEPPPEAPRDMRFQQERATTNEYLRRAVLAKLSTAVDAVGGEGISHAPFDAAYRIKNRRGLFGKGDPDVRLVMRVVPVVDAEAVEAAWGAAIRLPSDDATLCVVLMGNGLAPAKELSAAISEQRRRSRKVGPVVIPVDMRDWESLLPPETPAAVRALLDRLRTGG